MPIRTSATPLTNAGEIPGNLNGDRIADLKDTCIAGKALGSCLAHFKWDPRAGVNGDNRVDTLDLYTIIRDYGKIPRRVANAIANVHPRCLSLKSKGNWIICVIELPEEFNVSNIDVTAMTSSRTIEAESRIARVGGCDGDATPDPMVESNRQSCTGADLAES